MILIPNPTRLYMANMSPTGPMLASTYIWDYGAGSETNCSNSNNMYVYIYIYNNLLKCGNMVNPPHPVKGLKTLRARWDESEL